MIYEDIFQEIGLPVQDAVSIMDYLKINRTELKDPNVISKFKYVAQFVKDFPNKDRFFTRLSKAGQINVNKLDFFYEYCQHRSQLEALNASYSDLEKNFDATQDEAIKFELDAVSAQIEDLHNTLEVYES